jgi:NADPH:quinone reductase-like Zn-dependent oxidoreductase
MKGIVYTQYGPPQMLKLKEVEKPIPTDKQVLVKVHAASINALDSRRFESQSTIGRFMDERLIKATGKVLGADIAGRVETVGASVTQFKPGDEVFGISAGSVGGFAEYACTADNNLVPKPSNLSFEEAAAVPVAALTALQGLRDTGHIQPGQQVLIQGASGGVGTFAVQIAKAFGAQVTAVCSTRNLDMVRQIGADHVIDYTKDDFTRNDQRYDVIAAVNGHHSILDYRRVLRPSGVYVAMGGSIAQIFQAMLLGPVLSMFGSKKLKFMGISNMNRQDLAYIASLLESGKITPVIDKCYPLSEAAEAFRYVVEEHAKGKVVLTVPHSQTS